MIQLFHFLILSEQFCICLKIVRSTLDMKGGGEVINYQS